MEFIIKHDKLKDLLAQKGRLINEGRKYTQTIEEAEEYRNKLALQAQKVQDKVTPIVLKKWSEMKEAEGIDEFEEIERVELKDDNVIIHTYNALEEFKKAFRDKQKQK
jgi:hypothetical protein